MRPAMLGLTADKFWRRVSTLLLAMVAGGCAAGEQNREVGALAEVVEGAATDAGAATSEPSKPPEESLIAEVTANGSGCPAGTSQASIASDGKNFRIEFSSYEAKVDEQSSSSTKECQVRVKLRTPPGLSYAVASLEYEGHTFLEKGVTGFQTSAYYFQGNPVPAADTEQRTDFVGPVDRPFTQKDAVGTDHLVWSPCGVERDLNIRTRIGVRNGTPRASGSLDLTSLKSIGLVFKKCESPGDGPERDASVEPEQPDAGANPSDHDDDDAGRRRCFFWGHRWHCTHR